MTRTFRNLWRNGPATSLFLNLRTWAGRERGKGCSLPSVCLNVCLLSRIPLGARCVRDERHINMGGRAGRVPPRGQGSVSASSPGRGCRLQPPPGTLPVALWLSWSTGVAGKPRAETYAGCCPLNTDPSASPDPAPPQRPTALRTTAGETDSRPGDGSVAGAAHPERRASAEALTVPGPAAPSAEDLGLR